MESTPDIHQFKLFSQTNNTPVTIYGGGGESISKFNKSYIVFAFVILSFVIILAQNSNKIIQWVKTYWNDIQLSMFLSSSGEWMSTYVPENFYSTK
jgi:hypothetical protein